MGMQVGAELTVTKIDEASLTKENSSKEQA